MKTLISYFAAMLIFALPVCAGEPSGRYIIVAGTVTMGNGGEKKVILKMDTVTGDTWQYTVLEAELGKNSGTVEGWGGVAKDVRSTYAEVLKRIPNTDDPKTQKP